MTELTGENTAPSEASKTIPHFALLENDEYGLAGAASFSCGVVSEGDEGLPPASRGWAVIPLAPSSPMLVVPAFSGLSVSCGEVMGSLLMWV